MADVIGGVAGELFQRFAEAVSVAGQPAGEEVQHFSEFGSVEPYFGHGFTLFPGWVA